MDNSYLKTNVMPALTEALTAMAVQSPEDRVEFVGKYLLAYVERKIAQEKLSSENKVLDQQLADFTVTDQIRQDEKELEQAPTKQKTARYETFVGSIQGYSTKQDAFDAVAKFLETQLEIPAAYVATRYVNGETTDVLKYVAKGDSDPLVLGKKLNKPAADDSEEAPERQGVSFEAFKQPEIPESDEPPPEDGQEVVPKGPPPLQPFSVINVMRDRRVKFFGIPKLGAYLAVPFTYPSVDHDAAITYTPADGETPASFSVARKDAQFMVACDTIGCYRLFKNEEIERISRIGTELLALFERLENNSEERLKAFLNGETIPAMNAATADFAAKIPDLESAAVAAANASAAAAAAATGGGNASAAAEASTGEGEGEEGGGSSSSAAAAAALVEEAPEVKTARESLAVLTCWNQTTQNTPGLLSALSGLTAWEAGVPLSVVRLVASIAQLTAALPNDYLDRCGDVSWTSMSTSGLIGKLGDVLVHYDPTATTLLMAKEQKFVSVKAFVENNTVLDGSVYPSFLPICAGFLVPWLTKALAAREAQLALHGESLEIASW